MLLWKRAQEPFLLTKYPARSVETMKTGRVSASLVTRTGFHRSSTAFPSSTCHPLNSYPAFANVSLGRSSKSTSCHSSEAIRKTFIDFFVGLYSLGHVFAFCHTTYRYTYLSYDLSINKPMFVLLIEGVKIISCRERSCFRTLILRYS